MLVATVEKFGENAEFHLQCLGNVSPAMSVSAMPSVTSEKRIARKCLAIMPANSPACEPAPGLEPKLFDWQHQSPGLGDGFGQNGQESMWVGPMQPGYHMPIARA